MFLAVASMVMAPLIVGSDESNAWVCSWLVAPSNTRSLNGVNYSKQ